MTQVDFTNRPLTVKNPPDFTVISTFAGCGGSSTGYVWAGGKVLLAVEWDKDAVSTYKLNYPNTPIYHGNISELSVEQTLEITGLKPGELDIFDGSPPCQGFSTVGKRAFNDPRNQLFQEYVRLLQGLQPKVFVMENVSGMVKGKMKLIFAEIMQELKASGYQVKAKLLNAKYLGVPQSRERIIIIGVRNDLGIQPSHPKPQMQIITVKEAIKGCATQPAAEMSDLYIGYWHKTPIGKAMGNSFADIKCDPDKPSPTLRKKMTQLAHWQTPRWLSVPEYACLASFPDCYIWNKDAIDRIGNSVPPRMMQAIAEHIRDQILFVIPHNPQIKRRHHG